MLRFVDRRPSGPIFLAQAICLLLGGATLASGAQAGGTRHPAAVASRPDADALLIGIYKDLAANHLNQAQARADALVEAYPNFQLGHLIRGDLLLMHAQPVTALGAAAHAPADTLKDLRAEAAVRLKSLSARPDADTLPRALLQLRDDQKYALVVDARQSRLYVYGNQRGQLKLLTDYYITQGKLGVNKLKEGDQKTPLGVYYITGRVAGRKLSDFYGAGALRINYPNEWDRLNGRGGSGIWLHGTPAASYSRPPLASDGCVVLTNTDLKELNLSVEVGKTPVIIFDHVEFVARSGWNAERKEALGMVEAWRRDIEGGERKRMLNHYSGKFKSGLGEDLTAWFDKNGAPARPAVVTLRELTLFRYPGRDDMIVGTFTQETAAGHSRAIVRKRQYWAREGAQWKIVFEGTL